MWIRSGAIALGLLGLLCGRASSQILPPIYKPLPVEEGARFHAASDSLRARAAELQARARALEEGARTLRQNGTGVVEKLRHQASKLTDEAGRLESQANADALTATALRSQADEFARRATERETRIGLLREEIARLRTSVRVTADSAPSATDTRPPPDALAPSIPGDSAAAGPVGSGESRGLDADGVDNAGAGRAAPAREALREHTLSPLDGYAVARVEHGVAEPPRSLAVDTLLLARLRDLEWEVRADSQTAAAFRGQVEDLSRQARVLQENAEKARQRAREYRDQEAQLRAYAEEITSGRSAGESTAARLEQEASELQQAAQRYTAEAKSQAALADEWRVQAGRILLPVRNRTEGMRFYGEEGRSVLRNLVFSVGPGGGAGSINSELVSDYAGPVRLGVGFVLADAGKERGEGAGADSTVTSERALERFYAGGGNFVIYSSLPLAFMRSEYHSLTLQTLSKLGLDIPTSRGTAVAGRVPTNVDVGLEAYATFNTFGSKIKAFALVRSAYAIGNEAFHHQLGRTEGGGFPYMQLTFGTEIASVVKVLLSGAHGADGLNREFSLTFQVAPNRN